RREREVDRAQLRQQVCCGCDGRVELAIAVDPHAALAGTDHVGYLAGGDRLFRYSSREVRDDLAIGLLEQVNGYELAESDFLDTGLVVEVGGRAPRQGRECLLAAPVVAEARKVQLDILESAGAVGPKAIDG